MWRVATLAMAAALCATTALARPPPVSVKVGPATCGVWNENRPRSQMRVAMAFWVRTYLSAEKGDADLLRRHRDADVQRLLDEHCRANPADDLQVAADAVGRELMESQTSAPSREGW